MSHSSEPLLACTEDPGLYDSTDYREHMAARQACLRCDHSELCRDVALTDRAATGTYGGDLFKDGSVVMSVSR